MPHTHQHDRQSVMDELDLPPRRLGPRPLPTPRAARRPSVARQWGWGLWDMVLRFVEFGLKMFGAALLVLVLLVVAAVWGWHHVVEAGVEKLQEITTTTTAAP